MPFVESYVLAGSKVGLKEEQIAAICLFPKKYIHQVKVSALKQCVAVFSDKRLVGFYAHWL